jgi:hypothetical protein
MASTEIQFVSNENGEPTAVIVPIELWREIESKRETAYRGRLRSLEFDSVGFEDPAWWDRAQALGVRFA